MSKESLNLATLIEKSHQLVVIVTPDTLTANRLEDEIAFFLNNNPDKKIFHFPDWETLPYDHFSPHQDIISARIAALYHIPHLENGVVITPISTLMQKLPPRDYLDGNTFLLAEGDKFDIDATRKRLEMAGYHAVPQVREHGEYAVRGSLMDVFPMGAKLPLRLDLLSDEIDTIRTFSPDTQLTVEKIPKIEILPAKEFPLSDDAIEQFRQAWRSQFSGNPMNCPIYQDISEGIAAPGIEYYLPFFFKTTATLLDYLPENSLLVPLTGYKEKAQEFWQEIKTRYEQYGHDVKRPLLRPEQLFLSDSEILHDLKRYQTSHLDDEAKEAAPTFLVDHKAQNPFAALDNFLKDFSGRVLFCAESTGRREVLLQLLQRIAVFPKVFHSWHEFLNDNEKYGIIVARLEDGLILDSKLAIITESQLFTKRIAQRRLRKETVQDPDALIKDLTELQIGAPIVHLDHGVGRYLGLETLKVGDEINEFLSLEYAGGDKLYVPVAALHLINRYSGMDPEHAPLNKLGTEHWQRAKRKVAEDVRDVAAELLDIYAKRAAQSGTPYQLTEDQYAAFAAAFPFEETPDQLQAIDQVISDMRSEKPMDRLVCGDVGFGKTEVAMRAAFVAIQNNKQVAVLVPTTLLAQQHYQTFLDRFADWPIRIETLSRFVTKKSQDIIISDAKEGKVDIIIGTHKLLQEDIRFKSLGLIIIDEEHRFGVKQKERLKTLRLTADILTLTATPIPRTLNMAFSGIRDLSLIATPPARRLSIKTFVHEYQDSLIQEAILREILRGGQVYFLHNDVVSIEKKARDIAALIPEARVGIAHGQMHERDLEAVMADFYHRRFNVLVCTTIIESGIDIPSANTIIINRADKLGLAQLHQLRGRVGRSHHQAYAYLLIPNRKLLTADAEKRLDAISTYEDLGIGFTLATHDLEIRGAGELLGEGQSGNMQAVGFTLYMDMLSRAVERLKSGKEPEMDLTIAHGPEMDLHVTTIIPDNYLGDVQLRLQFYKRIASAKTQAALDDIQIEMIDRFGLLPDVTKNLFALTTLKQQATALGIMKLEANAKGGRIEFSEKPTVDPMRVIKLIQTESDRFKLDGPTRLRFVLETHESKERIGLVEKILAKLGP